MDFRATPYTVTTGLLVAFALFVIYVRMKNWLDSNIPVFFYLALLFYMRAVEGDVPDWLILTGFGLTLVLRFEFMNPRVTKTVKFFEYFALAGIVFFSMRMVLQI
jgi:hypothetical protein